MKICRNPLKSGRYFNLKGDDMKKYERISRNPLKSGRYFNLMHADKLGVLEAVAIPLNRVGISIKNSFFLSNFFSLSQSP